MNGKKTVKKTAIAFLCVSFAVAAAGCDSLIKTDNEADMSRVVAAVDITKEKAFQSGEQYGNYKSVVQKSNGKIYKRDLIAAYLSSGYSSVQSGASYKDTFNSLLTNLVARKITVQYSMAYFLDEMSDVYSVAAYEAYMTSQSGELEYAESEKREQILTLKYFLTDGGTASAEDDEYARSVYALKKAVNSSLDSSETTFMRGNASTDDAIDGADEARTLPSNLTTEKSEYYAADYEIYTGYNTPDSCGEYERQDYSTTYSRTAAYNQFIGNLVSNGLISADEVQTTDFLKIDYYYVELLSQLEQALIEKFSDALAEEADESLTDEYVKRYYDEALDTQRKEYEEDITAFESAIGSLSDSSFVLYAPQAAAQEGGAYKYGYVYNILIPFSATDTQTLSAYKNDANASNLTKAEKARRMETYYAVRARLAQNIVAQDQRTGWFTNDKNSYAKKNDAGEWHFFEKYTQDMTGRYESAKHYLSAIPFDGDVVEEDGKIKSVSTPKAGAEKNILSFVNGVLESRLPSASGSLATGYKAAPVADAKYEFDYADFLYYKGAAQVGATNGKVALGSYFADTQSLQYQAVTAVNEIVFAYGTDPGSLNSYIGYTVTPDCDETFVKEFAYAAKEAVAGGVGTYTVCLTDYGWHIMYCNYVYDAGNVYGTADEIFCEANKENGEYKENTFARYFYEAVKSKITDENASIVQERMLTDYNTDNTVVRYTARYQDLLDMDN